MSRSPHCFYFDHFKKLALTREEKMMEKREFHGEKNDLHLKLFSIFFIPFTPNVAVTATRKYCKIEIYVYMSLYTELKHESALSSHSLENTYPTIPVHFRRIVKLEGVKSWSEILTLIFHPMTSNSRRDRYFFVLAAPTFVRVTLFEENLFRYQGFHCLTYWRTSQMLKGNTTFLAIFIFRNSIYTRFLLLHSFRNTLRSRRASALALA